MVKALHVKLALAGVLAISQAASLNGLVLGLQYILLPRRQLSRAARRCTTAAEESCTTGTMRKD